MPFTLLNSEHAGPPPPSPLPPSFTLTAHPGTDIWRKPPSTFSFNAPVLHRTLQLSEFKRARVTVTGPWRTLFDQGGLAFLIPSADGVEEHWQWVKTGIEFYEDKPHVGTVACDRWADWSLLELEGGEVTVEIEREVEKGNKTSSMWVYIVEGEGKKRPLREITWTFDDVERGGKRDDLCYVGVYAAKPTRDEDDKEKGLEVTFKDFELETWQGGVMKN